MIEHPSNGTIWRYYEKISEQLSISKGKLYLLIMCLFWLDGYEQARSRRRYDTAVYLNFGNLPMTELMQRKSKHLLALLPPNVDLFEAIREIIVKPCLQLEQGLTLTIHDDVQFDVCGAPLMILGDMVSQAECTGLIGPKAKFAPCRFSEATREQLDITARSDRPQPKIRDGNETYQFLTDQLSLLQKHGFKKIARTALKQRGFYPVLSPFWDLSWMRKHFFQHFALDIMHVSYEGNFKRLILYLCAKSGVRMRDRLNELAILYSAYPSLRFMKQGIVTKGSFRGRKVLRLVLRTAEEIECVVQILEVIALHLLNEKLITIEDYRCCVAYVRVDTKLSRYMFDRDQLPSLQDEICAMKEMFLKTFCNPTGSESNNTPSQNSKESSDSEEDDEDQPTRYPEEEDTEGEGDTVTNPVHPGSKLLMSGFNGKFPNFRALEYWGMQIDFLGPPGVYCTKQYESLLQEPKKMGRLTNNHNLEAGILAQNTMREAQIRAKWNYTTFLIGCNSLELQKSLGKIELNRRAKRMLADFVREAEFECESYDAFHFCGHLVRRGQFILYTSEEAEDVASRVEEIVQVMCEGKTTSLVYVCKLQKALRFEPQDKSLNLMHSETDLPLLRYGRHAWTSVDAVSKLIQVFDFPNYSGVLARNTWIRKEVKK